MSEITQEFIQDFGEAYQRFGLPKLMGRIVGLLITRSEALSLDEITEELGVSKGPVSQIMGRLREHRLVQRIWKHGDRRDYYAAVDDIFGMAFRNQMALMKRNLSLAEKFGSLLEGEGSGNGHFQARIEEMREFYTEMLESFDVFYAAWTGKREK